MVAGSFAEQTVHAEDDLPEPARLLDALETTIDAIKSFEVHVQVRTESFFSEQIIENGQPKPGLTVYSPALTSPSRSRQLFCAAGAGWKNWTCRPARLLKSTGRTTRQNASSSSDHIEVVLAARAAVGSSGGMITRRHFARFVTASRSCISFEGGPSRPWRAVKADTLSLKWSLDPARVTTRTGFEFIATLRRTFFLPRRNVSDSRWRARCSARTTVTERKKIGPGLDVPIKAITEFFSRSWEFGKFQQAYQKDEMSVDVTGAALE